jgi:hypothetical protein
MEGDDVVSDVDRVVQQLQVSTVGGIVTPAQQLMVVPAENRLEIEAMAQNKDIGFIEAGHRPRSRSTPSTARSTGCCTAPCSMLRNTRSPRDKPVGKDKSGSRSRRARGGPSVNGHRSFRKSGRLKFPNLAAMDLVVISRRFDRLAPLMAAGRVVLGRSAG